MLETQIIDTGVGIEKNRQKLLFIPFLELKSLQGIARIQDSNKDSIGLGLSCSQTIARKLGGDIQLKESRKGLTVFAFKIPMKLTLIDPGEQS